MKAFTHSLLTFLIVTIAFAASYGADDFVVHGRVSFDTGGFMVKNASETDWALAAVNTMVLPGDTVWVDEEGTAEIELPNSSFLRLSDGSKAEITALPPNALLRGWVGSFYVHRLSRSAGAFTLTTPSATTTIAPDSMVRIDVNAEGGTAVSVRWGSATVQAPQGDAVTATESNRVWVDPGYLPSNPTPFDRNVTDAFDNWNNDRARLLAEGAKTIPREIYSETAPSVGSYDLARYGDWVMVDNRSYWRPTVVVDYVPYHYGCWNYMPAVGHVWVDEYPFGYITSHYGRWRYTASYGWLWSYDPVWSPAWVASVHVSNYHVWAPVDYYNRPVFVTGGTFFTIGGVSFCSYGTSYVSSSYLYSGPGYIGVPNTTIINVFNTTPSREINIWNLSPHAHRRPAIPWQGGILAQERDYNPRRSIRGFSGNTELTLASRDRVERLERALNRDSFAPRRETAARQSERTTLQNRSVAAMPRSVRMNQSEQTYRPRGEQAGGRGDTARSLVPESARIGRTPFSPGDRQRDSNTMEARSTTAAPQRGTVNTDSMRQPRSAAGRQKGTAGTQGTRGGIRTNPTNVAVRDLDTAAPAPRGSGQLQRTPVRESQPVPRSGRGAAENPRNTPAPPAATTGRQAPEARPIPTGTRTAPAPTPPTRSMAPSASTAPSTRPAPTHTVPAPSVRTAPAPSVRTAPAPAPSVRTAPAPSVRTAPAPAPSVRTAPAPAPSIRTAPAPSVRSMPAPSVRTAPAPAPSVRSMPAPSAPRIAPAPSVRSAPAPSAPSVRSMPAPSAPRIAPAPSVRSAPAPSAPRGFSSPSISTRSMPSAPSGFSTPSVRSAPSGGSVRRGR